MSISEHIVVGEDDSSSSGSASMVDDGGIISSTNSVDDTDAADGDGDEYHLIDIDTQLANNNETIPSHQVSALGLGNKKSESDGTFASSFHASDSDGDGDGDRSHHEHHIFCQAMENSHLTGIGQDQQPAAADRDSTGPVNVNGTNMELEGNSQQQQQLNGQELDQPASASASASTTSPKMSKTEKREARARARRWSENQKGAGQHGAGTASTPAATEALHEKGGNVTENESNDHQCSDLNYYLLHAQSVLISILNQDWQRPMTATIPLWGALSMGIFILAVFITMAILLIANLLLFGMVLGGFGCSAVSKQGPLVPHHDERYHRASHANETKFDGNRKHSQHNNFSDENDSREDMAQCFADENHTNLPQNLLDAISSEVQRQVRVLQNNNNIGKKQHEDKDKKRNKGQIMNKQQKKKTKKSNKKKQNKGLKDHQRGKKQKKKAKTHSADVKKIEQKRAKQSKQNER